MVYSASTNRQTGDTADANGNLGSGYTYDMSNRLIQASGTTMQYAYAADNKRVWRGDGVSVDEIAYWSPGGQKLATYGASTEGGTLHFTVATTDVYFGARLIAKGAYNESCPYLDCVTLASVATDRLGSIGKFYPYGQERPSATANDTEKFTGYYRDAATGLDYADQRYEQPGVGRFMSPDPYSASAGVKDPGSWNRYAYVEGDPVNFIDQHGLFFQPPPELEPQPENNDLPEPILSVTRNSSNPLDQILKQVEQSETLVLRAAVEAAKKKLLSEDCAGLFLPPDQNTAENRQLLAGELQSALDGGDFQLMRAGTALSAGINPNVPAFTEGGSSSIIEGGAFFTGQARGSNGTYGPFGESLPV